MKIRSILTAVAIAAAVPAVASADHNTRCDDTEARYQARNKLAQVTVSSGESRDRIALPRGRFDYLELRALGTPIRLSDVEVRFVDGTSFRTGSRGVIQVGQGRVVQLPYGAPPVAELITHYGDNGVRYLGVANRRGFRYQPAAGSLEVFGVADGYRNQRRYD